MPATHTSSLTSPRWLTTGIVVLLSLVAANLLAWRSIEPDLWGHIQYGEDWLHAGTMPRTATHTYASPEHPWINHENLFELSVAIGQRTIGGLGLMIVKCLTGLCLLATMVRFAVRRHVPTLAAVAAMIPTAWGLAEFWLMRPQLFSFVFFALLLLAFERAFDRSQPSAPPRMRWLWLCVPLMIVWTNSHGGFLAGLCVLLAVLGLRGLERLWMHGRAAIPVVGHLALIGLVSIASVFVNPYGWELPYWMLVSLSQPRPEISEWSGLLDAGPAIVPFTVLTVLTILALCWTRRSRNIVELIVLVLIAVQSIGHIRHLAFFALAFGFWMPEHLVSLWERLVAWRPSLGQHEEFTPRAARWLKVQLAGVAAVLVSLLGWTFANFGVDRDEYPVSAIEFMAREHLHGKLVVTFDWAQYALAALSPATTVGFDGRYDTCYPVHVVDMHFDLLFGLDPTRRWRGPDSGPIDPQRVLSYGDPDLVLLNRRADLPAVELLANHPDWVLLYSDGLAGLWGRRSRYDDPQSPSYFAEAQRLRSDDRPSGIAAWPGFPGRTGRDAFNPDVARRSFEPSRVTQKARDSSL